MRPLPRQKIYKFYLFRNILNFFSIGFINYNKTNELTQYLQKYFNIKNILCLNRGRIGAYLSIKSVVNDKKNKIILSPFTIFDLVNMVVCAGGNPVFCDVDKKSVTINMKSILEVYDDKVAAILITHTHLINEDIKEIIEFCKKKKIILIEDCAISFGTKLNNQFVGTLGDISFFSFGVFKFISSLNGGMILSKNKKIFEKILKENANFKNNDILMLFKNYFKSFIINILTHNIIFKYLSSFIIRFGYLNKIKLINNFSKNDPSPVLIEKIPESYKKKISNSQSAIILNQIPFYLNDFKIRIENAYIYYLNLKDINEILIPKFENNYQNGWINFPIMYKHRDKLLNYLFKNNRDLAIYFYRNCNDLEIFKNFKNNNLKTINEVTKEIIILPTYPKYEKEQIRQNIKLIRKYFNK